MSNRHSNNCHCPMCGGTSDVVLLAPRKPKIGSKISRRSLGLYREYLTCLCGGNMLPTEEVFLAYPPKYPHTCEKCGYMEVKDEAYPRVVSEEV